MRTFPLNFEFFKQKSPLWVLGGKRARELVLRELVLPKARFDLTAFLWNGNEKDLPHIVSAKEVAFARRIRASRLSSSLTPNPELVNHAEKRFLEKADLGEWLGSPRAALTFWRAILMPWLSSRSLEEDRRLVAEPGPQVVRDTAWLLARMAGDVLPTGGGSGSGEEALASRKIIESTHKAAMQLDAQRRVWTITPIAKLDVPENYGVRHFGKGGGKSKAQVFEAAVGEWPYLWTKTAKQYGAKKQIQHCRRAVNISKMEAVLGKYSAEERAEIFGDWRDWGPELDDDAREGGVPGYHSSSIPNAEGRGITTTGSIQFTEIGDIFSGLTYLQRKEDRRQEQSESGSGALLGLD